MALTGRAALVAALGALLVLLGGTTAAVVAVDAVLLLLVLLDVLLAGSVRGLRVTREGATRGRQGEPVPVVLVVRNAGRRPVRGRLREAWPPSAGASPPVQALAVPAGEVRRLETVLVPRRRGDLRAGRVTVRSTGPLGLAARQGRHEAPWAVRVLPAFASRRHLPALLDRLRAVEGQVAVRGSGRGAELDALRPWVEGDDARDVDWRATARSTAVVVRRYRPEQDRRVVVVVDTGRSAAARVGDAPRLDHALDAALLLAAVAERAGDVVDVLAVDTRVRADVPGRRGGALPRLVDALADVEPRLVEPDLGLAAATVLGRVRRRALVVLLTDLNPAALEEGLLPVLGGLARRHAVVVAAVADPEVDALAVLPADGPPPTVEEVHTAAAAERTRTDRRRLATELRRRGVEVVDAPPAAYPPAVVEVYLRLKGSGRL